MTTVIDRYKEEIKSLNDEIENLKRIIHTRATPSADTLAGLARYSSSDIFMSVPTPNKPKPSNNGEYVLHSEAAAVVAEVVADRDSWRRTAERCKSECNAAEAELDQIKAQEPVAYGVKSSTTGRLVSLYPASDYDNEDLAFVPEGLLSSLYAAPVDQTAEIEMLRNALREVHTMIEHDRTGKFKIVQNVINAALSGKEPS